MAAAKAKQPDAITLLKTDHKKVRALLETLDKTDAPARRTKLFDQIETEIVVHATIEEEIFYPAARESEVDSDLLDEAEVEHASAKDLIAQIKGMSPDDELYDAKVKVLGEYITHHVVEEHTEMFTKCRRSNMDLVGLRGEMQARKLALDPVASQAADAEAANDGKGKPTGILASLFSKA
jgi:hemerythrin superfamily protein